MNLSQSVLKLLNVLFSCCVYPLSLWVCVPDFGWGIHFPTQNETGILKSGFRLCINTRRLIFYMRIKFLELKLIVVVQKEYLTVTHDLFLISQERPYHHHYHHHHHHHHFQFEPFNVYLVTPINTQTFPNFTPIPLLVIINVNRNLKTLRLDITLSDQIYLSYRAVSQNGLF